MTANYSAAVEITRDYYNSSDADNFYFTIWGGEDIHIGLYTTPDESIFDASRRTVEHMAALVGDITPEMRVIDLGAGYGGAARFLAHTYGCKVVALNLSEIENERDRQMNEEQGVSHLIEVVDAGFESVPYPDDSFDLVWSQDAILHSSDRDKVMAEMSRVLKPGGQAVFTDIMQKDDLPEGVLQPILDRIHLESLGSLSFYREAAERHGLKEVGFHDHSEQLPTHYARVLKEMERREADLRAATVSNHYIARMKKGLGHWVNGGNNGYLEWGILHFRAE